MSYVYANSGCVAATLAVCLVSLFVSVCCSCVSSSSVPRPPKAIEGDGGQQWTCDDFDNMKKAVDEADMTFGKSGYKTIGVAVAVDDGPMKYAGTLPIMDPPRADTADTIAKIKNAGVGVKETCIFLQLSNSSAILIFNARTQGFLSLSLSSVPAIQLFMSAVISQCIVNGFVLNSGA